jgi:hypothetical protein
MSMPWSCGTRDVQVDSCRCNKKNHDTIGCSNSLSKLDVSTMLERLRPSSTPTRAHYETTSSWMGWCLREFIVRPAMFCTPYIVKNCNVQYDATENIPLPHRPLNKTMHQTKNSRNLMLASRRMSHMTFTCLNGRLPNQAGHIQVHIMQSPPQQQRITRQKFPSPHHF